MIAPSNIESRVESLEREMEEMRRRLDRADNSKNWLERITGSQADEPDFQEVLELGRAARQADVPEAE